MDGIGAAWFYLLAALGFGFVIFIHELGHFLFAKWAGVRVDRFSIGFGPVIFRKRIGETEYALSLLPLGGYVAMLGQEDLPENIPEADKVNPRSYLAKSAGWRALILLGGVLFNLISSYIILVALSLYGRPIIAPVVGEVQTEILDAKGHGEPSPAARLGLQRGDHILEVNGEEVRSFEDLTPLVMTSGYIPLTLTVQRRGSDAPLLLAGSDGRGVAPIYDPAIGAPSLGIKAPAGWLIDLTARVGGEARPDDPRPGERIVAVDGQDLAKDLTGQELMERLQTRVGQDVALTLARGAARRVATVRYAGSAEGGDGSFGFPVRIGKLAPDTPAAQGGLRAGDVVLRVEDQAVTSEQRFLALLRARLDAGQSFAVTVQRDGHEVTCTITGRDYFGIKRISAPLAEIRSGVLPVIPPGPDGTPGPLATAGLKPGDALIALEPVKPRPGGVTTDQLLATYVSGGTAHVVPISDGDLDALVAPMPKPFVLARLLGVKAAPTLAAQLFPTRVLNTGDGHGFPSLDFIQVADAEGVEHSVGLGALADATRHALLADLQAGDWLTGLTWTPDGAQALAVVRGAGKPAQATITPRDAGLYLAVRPETTPYQLRHGWTEVFSIANHEATSMVVKTLQIIPRFFRSAEQGGIDSSKTLSGPLGIFGALKRSAETAGFGYYLNLVALIGLNLFLVNLLPIPITDGGQLVFLAIETIIRRPLPALARVIAGWIGLALVGALMLYVLSLDSLRLAGVM
jgi:membrane-associated protease RseP (regulator of RpoE activity)